MHSPYYTLITGASEGFGKSLALECAARKMNLILVALPGPELNYLADFIKHNYQVDAIAIEKDLTFEENCKAVYEQINEMKLPVNMLINNAGLGGTLLFSEGSFSFYQKQIKLNIIATTLFTHLFLDMLKVNGRFSRNDVYKFANDVSMLYFVAVLAPQNVRITFTSCQQLPQPSVEGLQFRCSPRQRQKCKVVLSQWRGSWLTAGLRLAA